LIVGFAPNPSEASVLVLIARTLPLGRTCPDRLLVNPITKSKVTGDGVLVDHGLNRGCRLSIPVPRQTVRFARSTEESKGNAEAEDCRAFFPPPGGQVAPGRRARSLKG